MIPCSFKLRIALLSAAISGAVLITVGMTAWWVIYQQRVESIDREIRTLAARHPGWFMPRDNYDRLTAVLELTVGEQRKDHVILLVRDAAGTVLYRSPHWPPSLNVANLQPGALPPGIPQTATNASGHRGFGRGFGPGPRWAETAGAQPMTTPKILTVGSSRPTWRLGVFGNASTTVVLGFSFAEVDHDLDRIRNSLLITLPIALCAVAAGGWYVAQRSIRPLRAIAETAEHVTAQGLHARIPQADNDEEISRVIHVLNQMMERLETSFQQATRFTADASHELKTPLTVIQGELENALRTAPPGSEQQRQFAHLIEEVQRLKTITQRLLLLAQADAGTLNTTRSTVNLSQLMDGIVEDARILGTELALNFDINVPPGITVEATGSLLHSALFNLLSNAVKYNVRNGHVRVSLVDGGDAVTLEVGNSGPGIPAEEQAFVFDRFHRARSAGITTDGVGLGLALAREIIRAHGGELLLSESRAGWTVFSARLPRHNK